MQPYPELRRTRIAPTPSGYLHLGNVLSFAITAALAAKTGAKILLRIDDLDTERVTPQYVQDIFDTLNFLELPWNEGPRNYAEYKREWSQVYRMEQYRTALQQLAGNGDVYACTCSRSEILAHNSDGIYCDTCRNKGLPADAKDANLRLYTDNAGALNMRGLYHSETVTLHATMRDFVVSKKDRFPAYQLATVIDDIYFGVDLVVRGLDLAPSTAAQLYLAQRLGLHGFGNITFYHHPVLMTATGSKLSKSAGDTSVQQLRKEHKQPSDIYSMIAGQLGLTSRATNWQELTEMMGV